MTLDAAGVAGAGEGVTGPLGESVIGPAGAGCRELHRTARKPTKRTFLIVCAIAHRRTDHLFVRSCPKDVGKMLDIGADCDIPNEASELTPADSNWADAATEALTSTATGCGMVPHL